MPTNSKTAKTADLCSYQLPSGKPCRQITLKDEQLCRHHRRLFHQSEAEMALQQSMERLAIKLSSLPTPDLLEALYRKLCYVHSTVRAVPEAQLALGITMERLRTLELLQAELSVLARPSQTPTNFPENSMKSMNQRVPQFLKTL